MVLENEVMLLSPGSVRLLVVGIQWFGGVGFSPDCRLAISSCGTSKHKIKINILKDDLSLIKDK